MSDITSICQGKKGQSVLTIPASVVKILDIRHKDRFKWDILDLDKPVLKITKVK